MITIDMQMPSCCLQCPMNHITNLGYMCILTSMRPQPNELREQRPGWCPLREGKNTRKKEQPA